MGTIRRFVPDDAPQVVALHGRAFGTSAGRAPAELAEYFREIFFHNPWVDDDLPSWVYESGPGRLAGFLGIVPRPMTLNGRPIRAAVSTQLMADPASPDLPGLQLMKQLFSGPQDLSLADGANESSHKIWMRLGGSTATVYSLRWTRPLRSARHFLSRLEQRRSLVPTALAGRPFALLADALAARLWPITSGRPSMQIEEEALTSETMLAHLPAMARGGALRPVYDAHSLEWLLQQVARKKRHGPLRGRAVLGPGRDVLGWYLYYVKPGGACAVVQALAKNGNFALVLERLMQDAWNHRATALTGRLDPAFVEDLAANRCWFGREGSWTLIHSRDPGITGAIHRGDALLTRLEGEWWMRFLGE